jgi:hypothetical protein
MALHHYDGGDSEAELVRAATALLIDTELDVVSKIKTVYWPLGNIVEIARARGYFRTRGFKGWCHFFFKKSDQHMRDCEKAWKLRTTFDDAYRWYTESNDCDFVPTKLTGPRFAIAICLAYRDRNKSESERQNERSRKEEARKKRQEAKEARLVGNWRDRYRRLAEEHKRRAEMDGWIPLILNQIEQEIAQEEGRNPGFTSDTDTYEDEPQRSSAAEQDHDEADEPQDDPDQPPAQDEILEGVAEVCGVTIEELLDAGGNGEEPEPAQPEPVSAEPVQSTSVVPFKSNPWKTRLKDVRLSKQQREAATGPLTSFKGRPSDSDDMLYELRSRFFHLVGEQLSNAEKECMQRQSKNFWRKVLKYHVSEAGVTPADILAEAH